MHGEMSNIIRSWAEREYVTPARREGRKTFAIPVRDVMRSLVEREALPRQNVPQVCQALRSPRKFLQPLGLEIERVEGPPSQTGTTVVFHYRFGEQSAAESLGGSAAPEPGSPAASLAMLRGLLREELARFGGGEAFLKSLRTDPETTQR